MSILKPLPHDAAALHVSGSAQYTDDIPTPDNTLHLVFGLSEIAHGRIVKTDLTDVKSASGVSCVLMAKDIPGKNDISPSPFPEPLLSDGTLNYIGQPIFICAATSHLLARRAAKLAKIEYKKKKAIITIEEAIKAKSLLEKPVVYNKGDPENTILNSEFNLNGTINIGGQEHFYLEGQAALAIPHDDGDITIHCSTQHPTEAQHKVADALKKPMNAVRVQVRRMGGGFGGKESQSNALAVACAIMANQTGKPCKMRYDRDDDMIVTGKRHDFRIDYNVGFNGKGKITGIEFKQFVRCGWSADLSLAIADRAMLHSDNAYFLSDAKITSYRLLTNTQSATAFRGFGGPQGMIGIEQVINHISQYLGKDSLTVREQNFYNNPSKRKNEVQTTPYHMQVKDSIIKPLVKQLKSSSNYTKRRLEIENWNNKNKFLKKGLALTPVKFGISFTLTHLNQAGALVHVYQDGSIRINHGGTEMGQGLFQKVAQVAAQEFSQPIENIKITATDTGKVPNTSATAASSGTDLNGMAVKVACEKIKLRLKSFLGKTYKLKATEIEFLNGSIYCKGKEYSFKSIIKQAYENRISLSATGFYATPEIKWDRLKGKGNPFYYFAYGAAVTEVIIDTLTGENRILRVDICHDAGKSINPAIDIGQIQGGYVQGAGWLTTEELIWNEEGKLMTHAPSTYKIPACSDRPRIFHTNLFHYEGNKKQTIYRSKAVGEPPLMLGISALMALNDAIASVGDWDRYALLDTPATPEKILFEIQKQIRGI
ncbi:MAG: xanthine dehydrogenase molybdopterin binding subunit [Paracoccaceae bacterium]|nr:xanthine dehydrogenase molybdopterin binding subunit [Paracoccaceae bacterium]